MMKEELNKEEAYDDFIKKYLWLVRSCEDYKAEAKECSSLKGRFHQYFIYGEFLDCTNWSQDLKNCDLCRNKKNNDACKTIIRNETERRLKRISGAKENDVWKKRDKPPENWNHELSEYWQKRNESSKLLQCKDEYESYVATHEPHANRQLCIIL